MGPTTRIPVSARPGSSDESVVWDPWRKAWVVKVRALPVEGAANDAILAALSRWLDVPPGSVRWVRAGRRRAKVAEVVGLDPEEVARRLRRASAATAGPDR